MKKLSLFILLTIIGVLLFASPTLTYAQKQSATIKNVEDLVQKESVKPSDTSPQELDYGTNPDVPRNLSTYTQSIFIEITSAASCMISGVDPIRPNQPCLGFDTTTNKIGYVDSPGGGALGFMGNMIGFTFNIPASSGEYMRYLADNFGVSQKSYAVAVDPDQCLDNPALCPTENNNSLGFGVGNGFESLKPLLNIWTAMRNLVYLLFVLVFIVLGLGIMFRIQIDPRAVMSIQSQLPKVVIALVLVTFSYAIAGFLVDMMYVTLFLVINIFQTNGLDVSTSLATNPINAAGGLGGVGNIAFDASKGVANVMTSLFDGTFGSFFKGTINFIFGFLGGGKIGLAGGVTAGAAVGGLVGSVPGAIIGGVIGATASGVLSSFGLLGGAEPFTIVVGAIAWLIIMIALLSALFRLWFTLLKTYVMLLVNITFSPIFIALGLFPGSNYSFGNWLRSITADLAAFPVVLILFSLGKTLQNGFAQGGTNSFVPPYIGDPGDMNAFASLIGMGIILLAPEAVNITKAALKAPDNKLISAIGRPLGTGQNVVGGFVGSAKNAVWHTNPYTNEPSRLKAAAKSLAGSSFDRIPGSNRVKSGFNKILPGKEQRAKKAEDKARQLSDKQKAAAVGDTFDSTT